MQMAPQVLRHPEARPQEASPVTNRSVLAGDGIAYAGSKLEGGGQHRPHCCNSGWVTIGQIVINENGDEEEEFAMYLCQRCSAERR